MEDEIIAFEKLDIELKKIIYGLLKEQHEFGGFFEYIQFNLDESSVEPLKSGIEPLHSSLEPLIKSWFKNNCRNSPIDKLLTEHPIALAYCLAVVNVNDSSSILPAWVIRNFIDVHQCFQALRNKPCAEQCSYCLAKLDDANLKRWFDHDSFREFSGEPLQGNAVNVAIQNKSLITIFPTGGGKSITFQLPALIAGETEGGLTVIISPLQSLMKDQVENLEKKSITDAVTINSSIDPIERSKAIEPIRYGGANLLYISPKNLSKEIFQKLNDI